MCFDISFIKLLINTREIQELPGVEPWISGLLAFGCPTEPWTPNYNVYYTHKLVSIHYASNELCNECGQVLIVSLERVTLTAVMNDYCTCSGGGGRGRSCISIHAHTLTVTGMNN